MAQRQSSPIDMRQLEILNLKLQNLADVHPGAESGLVWFNTDSGRIEFRGNTAPEEVSTVGYVDSEVSTLEAAIGLKADTTALTSGLALKADKTYVDTQDGLKADKTYVDTQLGLKADEADVTSALALKADQSGVDSALALKANQSGVDSALALKANQSDVDSALALKADTSYVDGKTGVVPGGKTLQGQIDAITGGTGLADETAARIAADGLLDERLDTLEADPTTKGYVDGKVGTLETAINAKADTTYVDGEVGTLETAINAKADQTAVDSALALKADQTAVDSALALKASITYVDGEVDTLETSISKKADTTAVTAALADKADTTYVDTELGKKANITYVDGEVDTLETAISAKADTSYVNTELGKKADTTYVDAELVKKANVTYVDTEVDTLETAISAKADTSYVNTELGKKADTTALTDGLALKADQTAVDNALALKANVTYVDGEVGTLEAADAALGERIDDLRLNTIPADADVALSSHKITGLADGAAASQDAATVKQVEGLIDAIDVSADLAALKLNTPTLVPGPDSGDVDFGGNKATGLKDGTSATDAVTFGQHDTDLTEVWGELDPLLNKVNGNGTTTFGLGGDVAQLKTDVGYTTGEGEGLAGEGLLFDVEKQKEATFVLDQRVDTLEGTVGGAGSGLVKNVADLQAADSTLQGNINTVSGNLATEVSDRAAADGVLDGKIATETSNRGTAITNAINQEVIDRNGAISTAVGPKADTTYVDSEISKAVNGTDWKHSVRAASTANVTLDGPQTVDGIPLVAGNRVLIKDQDTPSENGIYDVKAGAWARSDDANNDPGAEINSSTAVFVEDGDVNDNSQWRVTTNNFVDFGTTPLVWAQIGGASTYDINNTTSGLTLTGNVLTVNTNMVVRKHVALIGGNETIPVTHNLNTYVTAQAHEVATNDVIGCDIKFTDMNTVTFGFAVAPAAGAIRVVIHG